MAYGNGPRRQDTFRVVRIMTVVVNKAASGDRCGERVTEGDAMTLAAY